MKYLKLFENWNLNESITFSIEDYNKQNMVNDEGNIIQVYNPELDNLLHISYAFKSYLAKKNLIKTFDEAEFTPDGIYAFERTGIVNLYPGVETKEHLEKIVRAIQEFAKNNKLVLGKLTAEVYTDKKLVVHYQKGQPINTIRVIRIPIRENNNEEETEITKLNVSNTTAQRILRKMGFDIDAEDYIFNIPAKEIINRADSAKNNKTEPINTISHTDNVRFYNGASHSDDNTYIDDLVKIAKHAINNGYTTIIGS
jgi:hypothetical protein